MRKLLADVTGRLIRHELYVARFYLAKNNYEATIARVEYAIRNFSSRATVGGSVSDDAGLEPEALVLLGDAKARTGDVEGARRAYKEVIAKLGKATPRSVSAAIHCCWATRTRSSRRLSRLSVMYRPPGGECLTPAIVFPGKRDLSLPGGLHS